MRSTTEVDENKKEKRIKKQGGTKREAEDKADDAERSDRKSRNNYTESASSSLAPENKGAKRDTEEEEDKKGKRAKKPGGIVSLSSWHQKSTRHAGNAMGNFSSRCGLGSQLNLRCRSTSRCKSL